MLKKVAWPLDMGITWRGKRLLGENKTVRGPIIMAFFTMLYGFLLFKVLPWEKSVFFSNRQVVLSYFLVGLAYSLGELPNSFLKRQLSIPPGGKVVKGVGKWFFSFLDLFDSLVACGVVYFFLFRLSLVVVALAIFIGGMIHWGTDVLMKRWCLK